MPRNIHVGEEPGETRWGCDWLIVRDSIDRTPYDLVTIDRVRTGPSMFDPMAAINAKAYIIRHVHTKAIRIRLFKEVSPAIINAIIARDASQRIELSVVDADRVDVDRIIAARRNVTVEYERCNPMYIKRAVVNVDQMYTSSDISSIIRALEADVISIKVSYIQSLDPILSAIFARPNKAYELTLIGTTQAEVDRAIEIPNLIRLTLAGGDIKLDRPLPPSLCILIVNADMTTPTFFANLSGLVNLNCLKIKHDNDNIPPLALSTRGTSDLARGIAAMRGLMEIHLELSACVDPGPLITALPPSIEHICILQYMGIYGYDEFIRDAPHGFPNMRTIRLGEFSTPDPSREEIKMDIRRRIASDAS